MSFLKSHIVNLSICLVFFYSVWLTGNLGGYDQQQIIDDLVWYHSYTPALFIKKDLKLGFYKDSADYYNAHGMYAAKLRGNDNPVIKTTCGQSIMFFPFTVWVYLYYHGDNITGYEIPFSAAICISSLVYYLLALILLAKILRAFLFSERSIALTIICIGLGTNILSYTSASWGTPHVNDFFLLTCLMYSVIKWFRVPGIRYSILIGLSLGLLVLIRPTNMLFALIIVFYGVTGLDSLKQNILLLFKNLRHLIIIGLCVFIVLLPQFLYWKYVTDHWIFYSYLGESFYWNNPRLYEYVFGFRKGWIVYSPLVALALIGLFFKHRSRNFFLISTILIVLLMVYINSSWWCWWFGGCFGARSMVEVYPLLAIGFCLFFEKVKPQKIKGLLFGLSLTFAVLHNVKSSYLSRINVIHYDSMTFAAYKYVFLKVRVTKEEEKYIETLLVHPDYAKAIKGIDT